MSSSMEVDSDVPAGIDSLPWVEKYRPKSLNDLISHQEIISTYNNNLPHLLLYGPPGTGKTSTVIALARKMYGEKYKNMILELNASDDRGIAVVRERIKDFASTRTIFSSGPKLVLLDEADNMTQTAQAALRRVIEKFTKNTRFCLVCNYVSKIIPALQSRCTRFRFGPLPQKDIDQMLTKVVTNEGISITEMGRKAVLRLSKGDMRKCLNILQAASMAFDEIDEEPVYLCTGNPMPKDVQQIVHWLLNDEFAVAYNGIKTMQQNNGLALQDVIRDVHLYILRIQFKKQESRIYLIDQLSNIEHRLSTGTSEAVQLGSLVGACTIARDIEVA